jgi:hypothetical protein
MDIKLLPGENTPESFYIGSINHTNKGKTWEWFNNGLQEIWSNGIEITKGLIKGRLPSFYITNGTESKRVSNLSDINDEWRRGNNYESTKNKIWVNNGLQSKMVFPDKIDSGWERGMLKTKNSRKLMEERLKNPDRRQSWNSGKKFQWITNGVCSKQILLQEDIPQGFYKGRIIKLTTTKPL